MSRMSILIFILNICNKYNYQQNLFGYVWTSFIIYNNKRYTMKFIFFV